MANNVVVVSLKIIYSFLTNILVVVVMMMVTMRMIVMNHDSNDDNVANVMIAVIFM